MSGSTQGLDIRLPIGGLFTALGVIVAGYGLVRQGDPNAWAPPASAGVTLPGAPLNVNLWWGVVMLAFGLFMFLMGRRAESRLRASGAHPTAASPEGVATEQREHRTGLER